MLRLGVLISTGAGIFVITGDGSVPTGVLPNNGIVIARIIDITANYYWYYPRIQFQCCSGSLVTGVGQLVDLDGNTFNIGDHAGVFSVTQLGSGQPGSLSIRNRAGTEDALTAADEGVYTCRIPDESETMVDVNIGVYMNGFNSELRV